MIRLTTENTAKAIERCKTLRPKVQYVADRVFNVSSSRNANVYQVKFDVQNGERLAECNCKASERGLVCYHIVAGATANINRQAQKKGLTAWN
jgi:hypothetical protein